MRPAPMRQDAAPVPSGLLQEALHTEDSGIDWRAAAAGGFATVAPLAVGLALDETVAGLTAAIGGLNTALGVPRATFRRRLGWGALCAVASAGSLALAAIAGDRTWALVLVTFAWVGAWALLRVAGPVGAVSGFAIGAVLVIVAGVPSTAVTPIDELLLWYVLGAGPGLALMVLARTPGAVAPPSVSAALHATLRAAPAVRAHALRFAVAVAAATLLYRVAELPHGYWVPLTVLAILQPHPHATAVRSAQRALGTLGGAGLIVAITLVTDSDWALVGCAAFAAIGLFALKGRGYFWLVVMLTPTALLLLSVADFQGDEIALERVGNSAVGIAIGLIIAELTGRWSLVRRSRPPCRRPAAAGSGASSRSTREPRRGR